MGHTDTTHNYHVHFPSLRMTLVKRDVKFDEEKEMRHSLERELQLHPDQELLVPMEEPREFVE